MKKQKKIINKARLARCETVTLHCENCDEYVIAAADVLDISFTATLVGKKYPEWRAGDGFIKLSAAAADVGGKPFGEPPDDDDDEYKDEREEDSEDEDTCDKEDWFTCPPLGERLASYVDVCAITLTEKDGSELFFYPPYDPLCDVLHGDEIDMTNCPSCERDAAGSFFLGYGSYSKQPTRKDNDYPTLVLFWDKVFGSFSPDPLKIKVTELSVTDWKTQEIRLTFDVRDRKSPAKWARIDFHDCQNLNESLYFPRTGECELTMARMSDGRIYVGLLPFSLDFTCAEAQIDWDGDEED